MPANIPVNFNPDNVMGNVVEVICDRSGLDQAEVIKRISDTFGGGDFGMAEDNLWTSFFGPAIDDIQGACDILWEGE